MGHFDIFFRTLEINFIQLFAGSSKLRHEDPPEGHHHIDDLHYVDTKKKIQFEKKFDKCITSLYSRSPSTSSTCSKSSLKSNPQQNPLEVSDITPHGMESRRKLNDTLDQICKHEYESFSPLYAPREITITKTHKEDSVLPENLCIRKSPTVAKECDVQPSFQSFDQGFIKRVTSSLVR